MGIDIGAWELHMQSLAPRPTGFEKKFGMSREEWARRRPSKGTRFRHALRDFFKRAFRWWSIQKIITSSIPGRVTPRAFRPDVESYFETFQREMGEWSEQINPFRHLEFREGWTERLFYTTLDPFIKGWPVPLPFIDPTKVFRGDHPMPWIEA